MLQLLLQIGDLLQDLGSGRNGVQLQLESFQFEVQSVTLRVLLGRQSRRDLSLLAFDHFVEFCAREWLHRHGEQSKRGVHSDELALQQLALGVVLGKHSTCELNVRLRNRARKLFIRLSNVAVFFHNINNWFNNSASYGSGRSKNDVVKLMD